MDEVMCDRCAISFPSIYCYFLFSQYYYYYEYSQCKHVPTNKPIAHAASSMLLLHGHAIQLYLVYAIIHTHTIYYIYICKCTCLQEFIFSSFSFLIVGIRATCISCLLDDGIFDALSRKWKYAAHAITHTQRWARARYKSCRSFVDHFFLAAVVAASYPP